ncbi:MAG: hypothetical protein H6711_32935 [Myxococcales bacterium]|nr:hypothetical protein [Myxococcales bacterium]
MNPAFVEDVAGDEGATTGDGGTSDGGGSGTFSGATGDASTSGAGSGSDAGTGVDVTGAGASTSGGTSGTAGTGGTGADTTGGCDAPCDGDGSCPSPDVAVNCVAGCEVVSPCEPVAACEVIEGVATCVSEDVCAMIAASYAAIAEDPANKSCVEDGECHAVQGACGIPGSSCWEALNDSVNAEALKSLAEQWTSAGCPGDCQCDGEAPSMVCDGNACAPG